MIAKERIGYSEVTQRMRLYVTVARWHPTMHGRINIKELRRRKEHAEDCRDAGLLAAEPCANGG